MASPGLPSLRTCGDAIPLRANSVRGLAEYKNLRKKWPEEQKYLSTRPPAGERSVWLAPAADWQEIEEGKFS
ncbi:MAG: hypothetical protein DMG67_09705 [Acidobacteria bacterium]|nr:MAG: hypothetical protein DMG67_09705 [Acidobacteriota bacterium]